MEEERRELATVVKLILSRKAFDSSAGGVANPIFDDGSMIPLPIPDKQSSIRYQDLTVAGHNLGAVASDLTRGRTRADHFAHLDPDLVFSAYPREPDWRPLFGQVGAAQTVLSREGVGPGDVFLFFGWFRRVSRPSMRLEYVKAAPDLHVLWGWFQIGEVLPLEGASPPVWMAYHPHLVPGSRARNNTMYVASETLDLDGVAEGVPGAGSFASYDDRLRLTKPGCSRSTWSLPAWFHPDSSRRPLGYHHDLDRWRREDDRVTLRAASRGQEFVLDSADYPEALPWIASLVQPSAGTGERDDVRSHQGD